MGNASGRSLASGSPALDTLQLPALGRLTGEKKEKTRPARGLGFLSAVLRCPP